VTHVTYRLLSGSAAVSCRALRRIWHSRPSSDLQGSSGLRWSGSSDARPGRLAALYSRDHGPNWRRSPSVLDQMRSWRISPGPRKASESWTRPLTDQTWVRGYFKINGLDEALRSLVRLRPTRRWLRGAASLL